MAPCVSIAPTFSMINRTTFVTSYFVINPFSPTITSSTEAHHASIFVRTLSLFSIASLCILVKWCALVEGVIVGEKESITKKLVTDVVQFITEKVGAMVTQGA